MEWQRLSERPLREAKVQITKHLGQGGGLQLVGVLSGLLPIWSTVHTCTMARVPGCRCMQGASVAWLLWKVTFLGFRQNQELKKKSQNAQNFLSRILSSGRHQRAREDSWVLSPDLRWPRLSVSEECSREGISQLLGQA